MWVTVYCLGMHYIVRAAELRGLHNRQHTLMQMSTRRYFQASGMPKNRLGYRANTVILLLSFLATHLLSIALVLYRYCQKKHIAWDQIPYR